MRTSARPASPGSDPIPLHSRALDDLSFIRDTMARAGASTSVPGWGGVAMGGTALAASWIASRQGSGAEWLAVWLAEGVLALRIRGGAPLPHGRPLPDPALPPRRQALRPIVRSPDPGRGGADAGVLPRRPGRQASRSLDAA